MAAATSTIIALAVTAIGAGISAYGQYQAGQTQDAIAQFNARQQQLNAQMQMQALQAQATMQRSQAQANFNLANAEAQARINNAKSLEQQALVQDEVNRSNLQERREEFERMQGTQRAAIAASGVVESAGTPLDLLAETAAKIQQDMEEQHYANEVKRETLFREAYMERLGGQFARVGATLDRDSSLATALLTDASGRAAFLAGTREAEITRLTGAAAAQAGAYQAAGTLFSGIGSAAGNYVKK
jgi:hypothetical protein